MNRLGDFAVGAVIYDSFTTFRPSTGAAYALAGTPVLSVYKDDIPQQWTTVISAANGTLTNPNAIGSPSSPLQACTVWKLDTSADGTFFATGHTFHVVITTGTVDSVDVAGSVVATFTLGVASASIAAIKTKTDFLPSATAGTAGGVPLLADVGVVDKGTAQGIIGTTGITLQASAAFGTNALVGKTLFIVSATTGAGQSVLIDSSTSTGGANTVTFVALPITLTGTVVYEIFASAPASTASPPTVLLSAGTGAGQLDFTSGVVKASLAQILGTALTETSGQIAAAFKKFFDKATPTGTINSLPDAVAGAAGGVFIAGTNAATSVTTGLTAHIIGTVDTVTTYTGNTLQTGDSFALIGTAGVGLTNTQLGATGIAAVWAYVIEGAVTAVQVIRGFAAVLMGKASGLATTTAVYRDLGDTKARITATVDADGNRTAVTKDLT